MRVLWLLILILVAIAAHAEDHNWHVLIVTSDGKVSLLKGLTKFDAEHTKAKLQGYAYTKEEKAAEAKARAEQDAAIEKIIRESKAPCPDFVEVRARFTDLGKRGQEVAKTWNAWQQKYKYAEGCIEVDGSIRKFQLGGGVVSSGFYYKQIEVFQ
jgi:hypothetical protein